MDIIKIAAIGVIAALLATLFRKDRGEVALLIGLGAGVGILTVTVSYLDGVLREIRTLAEAAGISSSILKVLLKILIIGYITQFASELCKDAGASSIATKIETGGKLLIVSVSLPIFSTLLHIITELV